MKTLTTKKSEIRKNRPVNTQDPEETAVKRLSAAYSPLQSPTDYSSASPPVRPPAVREQADPFELRRFTVTIYRLFLRLPLPQVASPLPPIVRLLSPSSRSSKPGMMSEGPLPRSTRCRRTTRGPWRAGRSLTPPATGASRLPSPSGRATSSRAGMWVSDLYLPPQLPRIDGWYLRGAFPRKG